ncbi:MAG: DNA repair protein RecN [Lentisphaeria bacterium]|nr:DNA repair protein RecN [Lentisphaeria bacterium]
MLNYLTINNFALIESASVEFSGGFTAVTGESGAGKSILMSSIELLAGGRVDRSAIRSGCKQLTVCGEFSIPDGLVTEIARMLDENGIEFEAEEPKLTIRRSITQNNTRNFINDTPVTSAFLTAVGGRLIDLHGANEQVSLTVPARQLELLDNFGNLKELRSKCSAIYDELKQLASERAAFEENLPDADDADRFSLIAGEIDRVSPAPGEDEELAARQRLGANARQVLETLNMLTGMLTENENGIADQLGSVYHQLTELEKIDSSLTGNAMDVCAELQNSVSELSGSLAALTEKIDLDPETLAATEARLSEIHTLKRRYGPTLEQVFATREKAETALSQFRNAQKQRQEFDRREKELTAALNDAATGLSRARKSAAGKFLQLAKEKLVLTGFDGAALEAEFTAVAPGANGMDKLELLFNANRGEELRPLRKVASSGELSRLMLALKTVLADADSIPTVIFDEIDMNIGGETANKVANELHTLGKKRQILCISHLAQVAARADNHFLVSKSTRDGRTVSRVEKLDDPVVELSRMLGGGDSALRHAGELHKICREA